MDISEGTSARQTDSKHLSPPDSCVGIAPANSDQSEVRVLPQVRADAQPARHGERRKGKIGSRAVQLKVAAALFVLSLPWPIFGLIALTWMGLILRQSYGVAPRPCN